MVCQRYSCALRGAVRISTLVFMIVCTTFLMHAQTYSILHNFTGGADGASQPPASRWTPAETCLAPPTPADADPVMPADAARSSGSRALNLAGSLPLFTLSREAMTPPGPTAEFYSDRTAHCTAQRLAAESRPARAAAALSIACGLPLQLARRRCALGARAYFIAFRAAPTPFTPLATWPLIPQERSMEPPTSAAPAVRAQSGS